MKYILIVTIIFLGSDGDGWVHLRPTYTYATLASCMSGERSIQKLLRGYPGVTDVVTTKCVTAREAESFSQEVNP